MAASTLSLKSFFTSLSTNSTFQNGFLNCNLRPWYESKTIVLKKRNCSVAGQNLKLNCLRDKGMDASTSALALSKHVVEATKYFSITVSFGSVKSLISLPCFMSQASIPAAVREARGLTEDLIRNSVGIEDVDDLISDLANALTTCPA